MSITVVGRLVADPQLRFTQSGAAVASFTVAHTKRKFDKHSNKWVDDGDTLFLDVSVWNQLAEGCAEGLSKGSPVVVTGELRQRNWEDKQGQKRVSYSVDASDVGLSVRAKAQPKQQEEAPW